jgi:SAM-dependent methyltransferase
MLCASCGFAQLSHVVEEEAIYRDYLYETTSSLGLVRHFEEYADEVVERVKPPAGSLVIDAGSNDGTLLRSFGSHGLTVLGIDPAVEIARRATAAGIETLPEFLTVDVAERVRAERGGAAVVTANNVVANIDELDEFVVAVRELLAPDGVFVFESYYLRDLIDNLVFDFLYHEHISSFSVRPLVPFFERHGLELIDALRVPTKGGSLRYTVQLAGGPRTASATVGELIAEEERARLQEPVAYERFSDRIERAKADVLAHLGPIRDSGATIAGYGASPTSTTLIYHFGLGEMLDYLVDDFPSKQGLYSPGLHLPVLPADALEHRRPDHVVIIAWRYWEAILEKRPELGGEKRVVVPMPALRLV